jgi:hypothetical protein
MLRRAITALRMRDSPSAEEEGMRWLLLGGRSAETSDALTPRRPGSD